MGFFWGRSDRKKTESLRRGLPRWVQPPSTMEVTATLLEGHVGLEVVGESYRQDDLWRIVGGHTSEYVTHPVIAALVPEDNPHDANAIAVQIDGLLVGYLSRSTAAEYRPGLMKLMREHRTMIALSGNVMGGGIRGDGIGMLGVFLEHDPGDFVEVPEPTVSEARVRTGEHAFIGQGALDWRGRVPDDDVRAITHLRGLLGVEQEPVARHFVYAELEHRLYHSRNAFTSALVDYDQVCLQHDGEMDSILFALKGSLGGVPLLDTYRQSCIRHQHAKDWEKALWWAERGLSLYGTEALNPEFPVYLEARRARYQREIDRPPKTTRQPKPSEPVDPVETLTCASCGSTFKGERARGRKPTQCPACRVAVSAEADAAIDP